MSARTPRFPSDAPRDCERLTVTSAQMERLMQLSMELRCHPDHIFSVISAMNVLGAAGLEAVVAEARRIVGS